MINLSSTLAKTDNNIKIRITIVFLNDPEIRASIYNIKSEVTFKIKF